MAKLTKAQHRTHMQAAQLLDNGRDLTDDEIEFIFTNWHPGAEADQTGASAYFTPVPFAQDFSLECPQGGVMLDLCAGIGVLSYFGSRRHAYEQFRPDFEAIICVERNPRFVEVGRRIFPEAHWIEGDALDPRTWAAIREIAPEIDFAICNPPFGRMTKSAYKAPRYKGAEAEFSILDVATMFAPSGAAIIPAMSAPFDMARGYQRRETPKYRRYEDATGVSLQGGVGIDPDYFRDDWHNVAPAVAVVTWDVADYEDKPQPIATERPAPAPAATRGDQLALAL